MSSWYDTALVTSPGEEILRGLDDWAIRELRQHKLIWSSWGTDIELNTADHVQLPLDAMGWGCREIEVSEPARLRLFFLSLLWRAAASSRLRVHRHCDRRTRPEPIEGHMYLGRYRPIRDICSQFN